MYGGAIPVGQRVLITWRSLGKSAGRGLGTFASRGDGLRRKFGLGMEEKEGFVLLLERKDGKNDAPARDDLKEGIGPGRKGLAGTRRKRSRTL